jgi:hypothetical protein
MKIKFANDPTEVEVPNFNWVEFREVEMLDESVFGWYGKGSISGQHYIEISKEDYNKNKQKNKTISYGK